MDISQLNGLSQSVSTQNGVVSNNPNSSEALQNDFLTMMVAQIQNQDPLNPMDGTEYVSQLAQFSQVESMDNMTAMMQNQSVLLDNLQVFSTAALVDQTVYVRSNSFTSDVDKLSGQLTLQAPSSQVNLVISDEYGSRQILPLGHSSSGVMNFDIDVENLDLKGNQYSLQVELSKGQDYQPDVQLAGRISGVEMPIDGGSSMIHINGIGTVPVYDIAQFGTKLTN